MRILEPALPHQLQLHSIGYVTNTVTVVTMRDERGAWYYFQPLEGKRYIVIYDQVGDSMMKMATLTRHEAPQVLGTIFSAGTLENILELQKSRQLTECAHRRRK